MAARPLQGHCGTQRSRRGLTDRQSPVMVVIGLCFFPLLCSVFEVTTRYIDLQPVGMGAFGLVCSAKDQLTNTSVAIKKIMKPFSTPVLAKRTYRELKLLKHIRHENIISLSDIFISPLEDIYFVTELLGTDLHRLLTSRPLEKQFIQYFLYQILVSRHSIHNPLPSCQHLNISILILCSCDILARPKIHPFCRSYPSRPEALQYPCKREL